MVRIALPSRGRLASDAALIVEAAGINTARPARALRCIDCSTDLEIVFMHPKDCDRFVSEGWVDIGFSALDILAENAHEVQILAELNFGVCQLVLEVKQRSDIHHAEQLNGQTIATRYPRIARNWFGKRGVNVKLIEMHGSLELAPSLGICSAVLDSYETGETARANELIAIETVMCSQAVLIGRKGSDVDPQLLFYIGLLQETAASLFGSSHKLELTAKRCREGISSDMAAVG